MLRFPLLESLINNLSSEDLSKSLVPGPRAEGGETPCLLHAIPAAMASFLHTLTRIAIVGVFIVLVLGVLNMMRGSSPNRSQMLMRLRVILQFTAIVVMMAALYFTHR